MSAVFRSKVDGRFKWIGLLMPCLALLGLISPADKAGFMTALRRSGPN